MELKLTRETLRFERMAGRGGEQVTIEGEATLPGSMRDAVTVLSVQAQAHLSGAQAGNGEAGVRGRVCFQVLYTQGDLTRVRSLETGCDFMHTIALEGVTPGMRVCAAASVQETEGTAANGRMTLRALLEIGAEAFEVAEREIITAAEDIQESRADSGLQTKVQTAAFCLNEELSEGRTLVREEFDLPGRLEIGEVLGATATARADELSGGNGRASVSGVIEVRVLHRPKESGHPLVTTVHEMPFDVSLDARPEGEMQMSAEVMDVMADSVESDKGRTLRVEAEVKAGLRACSRREMQLLEDLYTLQGPVLDPVTEELDVHASETHVEARESLRLQVMLPQDASPMDTVLAAFAQPVLAAVSPAGRRLNAEGIMNVTLIYLPVDSDIPVSVHTREPFAMTFPIETGEDVNARAYTIETSIGAATSDRAELRCVLGLRAVQHGMQKIRCVREIHEYPQEKQTHGFVLVWPAAGETRWETARKLRVAESALRPAGKHALLAFKR